MEVLKRLLNAKEAAAYLGMSRSELFKKSAVKPTAEQPIRKIKQSTRITSWDIRDLDCYVDQLKE